jgi:hypothetical protein
MKNTSQDTKELPASQRDTKGDYYEKLELD